jgi:hypothetical protein
MKRMWTAVLTAALVAVVGIMPASAELIQGAYSIGGVFAWVDNDTGTQVPVLTSDAIDFRTSALVGTPGVAGPFIVLDAQGDFASFLTPFITTGAIKDITFAGAGNANFPAVTVTDFQLVGGLSFDLTQIVSVTPNGQGSLDIVGLGVFHHANFDDTPGEFIFTGQQSGGSFSFSASQSTVPEPATLLLLGSSLVAAGVFARRRR